MAFIYFFHSFSLSLLKVFLKRQSGYNECSTSSHAVTGPPTTTPGRPVSPLPVLLSQDYKHWRGRCAWTAGLPPACLSRMPRLLSFPILSFLSSFLPPEQLIYLPAALYLTFSVLAMPCGLPDFSSLIRDGTHAHCSGSEEF